MILLLAHKRNMGDISSNLDWFQVLHKYQEIQVKKEQTECLLRGFLARHKKRNYKSCFILSKIIQQN